MKTTFKKLITAFCLAVSLAVSVPALTSTLGISQDISTVHAANGWKKDAKGWYYLQGDSRVTGLKKIGKSTYYFDQKGYRVSGPVKIGKTTYYFTVKSGALYTGVSGLRKSSTEKNTYYYFNKKKNGTLVTSSWVKYKNGYFYADKNGRVKLGTIKVGKKLYHITKSGRMTKYGKSSFDKKYYYASSNGVLKTGIQKIGKYGYYFSPTDGSRAGKGSITDSSGTYLILKSGRAKTGWQKSKSGTYYYYDKNYRKASGLTKIGKNIYYFNPKKNNARMTNGWYKIGKYYYYLNSKGIVQTGFFKVGGYTYYANSKGVRLKGWQTVNGRKYYLDSKTARLRTGWLTYKNKKYYLNPTKSSSTYGAAKTGFVKIKGSWYYFNQDGSMKTGWLLDNMKYYYFDKSTGKMYTGTRKVDGKTYKFGSSGGIKAQISGSWSIKVNRKQNFVVVYKGNTEVKAFVCSTAANVYNTPTGYFSLLDKLYWHELNGPTWGQYCSHITSDILFHSVPCTRYNDPYSLKAYAYNQLGTSASGGCIRLSVKHAKWLFENCPKGTSVYISDSVAKPKNVAIERTPKIPVTQSYDPTDTFQNPYSVR